MLTSRFGVDRHNSKWNQRVHFFQPGARFSRMNLFGFIGIKYRPASDIGREFGGDACELGRERS
jgi:hypothetical protein